MALDWVQQFYKDNHINGRDGRLDEAGRNYWLGIAADQGIDEAKRHIEYAARNSNPPTWNLRNSLDWVQQYYADNNIGGQGGNLDWESRQYWLERGDEVGEEQAKGDIKWAAERDGTWEQGTEFDVNDVTANETDPRVTREINAYSNLRKTAYDTWENAESTHTGTIDNLNKLGISYDSGGEKWDVIRENENNATIDNSDLLDIKDEYKPDEKTWVEYSYASDYSRKHKKKVGIHGMNIDVSRIKHGDSLPTYESHVVTDRRPNGDRYYYNYGYYNWTKGWFEIDLTNKSPQDVINTLRSTIEDRSSAKHASDLINTLQGSVTGSNHYWGEDDDDEYRTSGQMKDDITDSKIRNGKIKVDNGYNKKWNAVTKRIDTANKELNTFNKAKNNAYDKIKSIANHTSGGEFVLQRDKLKNEAGKILQDAGIDSSIVNELGSKAYEEFKNFYRKEKLIKWDTETAAKIPGLAGSTFDADYYRGVSNSDDTWNDAVTDDDIDITERYGNVDTYALQHWSSTGRHAGLRAYAADIAEAAKDYKEVVTDADKAEVRKRQLGIDYQNSQTDRLLKIPEIANEFYKASRGDQYWADLAKEKLLDLSKRDEFVALYRLSEREADKDVMFKYAINMNADGVGITQLEDAVNQAVGEKAQIDVKRFGALTQNVLKDTINEMKEAKKKEEFLSTVSGFSGFSEIMDINKSLTNSILGDSGVGGYLNMLSGGRAEESLEKGLRNVTGIGNNVTYNWQKWFDEKLVEKYGTDYRRFLPLEEKQDIIKAFQSDLLTTKPYDAEKEKFSQEFLDLAGYKTTEKLKEFLKEQGDEGSNILSIIKGDLSGASQLDPILTSVNQQIQVIEDETNRDLDLDYATGKEDDPNTPDIDESKSKIKIEASFARDFIDNYLTERFDTSKSMDEFTEYLSVRQEEQNPFQTQTMLNAVQQEAELHGKSYLDAIRTDVEQKFDFDFYMNPTQIDNIGRQDEYQIQKDEIAGDWENAKNNQDALVNPDLPTLGTWKQQLYRFGIDPNDTTLTEEERKEQFAKMHFQIVGQGRGYDPAEDLLNPTKVKDYIYETILPNLSDEALEQGTVFGKFITPEEFADDMLKGLDPENKDTWKEVLNRYGLESFEGNIKELKDYIMETFRTGSAQQIRENIKYLNEKRQKPTQKRLGVTYIQREEDYKQDQPKADTELYKTFQSAGFQGTEDEFYGDFFPDLNRSEQQLLTKAGTDDPLKTWGLDMSDPFASLGTIESFFDEDEDNKDTDEDDSGPERSYFKTDTEDDDWGYSPKKKEKQVLDEFTTLFKGL